MHDVVHLGTDPDGLYDLETFVLQKVAGDDDLTDEPHAQASVLGLDDYDPFAFDQLALHERLPEDDDSIKQPLRTLLPLRQGQILLHQEPLRIASLGVPPGHFGLVLTHGLIGGTSLVRFDPARPRL